jgi:hypothetical protein
MRSRRCRQRNGSGRQHGRTRYRECWFGLPRSENPCMRRIFLHGSREVSSMTASGSPRREVQGQKTAMDVGEKSDSVVVPRKSANEAQCQGVDGGKDAGQGNCGREKRAPDTAAGPGAPSDFGRIRQPASDDRQLRPLLVSRHYPRQEPYAIISHVRIRAGGPA